MTARRKRGDWGAIAYFLSLYFFVPVFLAKLGLGASWKAIGIAYAVWFSLLFLWGMTSRGTWTEKTGWPIVMGIFFTIPAILIGVLLLSEIGGVR